VLKPMAESAMRMKNLAEGELGCRARRPAVLRSRVDDTDHDDDRDHERVARQLDDSCYITRFVAECSTRGHHLRRIVDRRPDPQSEDVIGKAGKVASELKAESQAKFLTSTTSVSVGS